MSTYEVVVDNAKLKIHCNAEPPPPPETVFIDAQATTARIVQSGSSPTDVTRGITEADGGVTWENNGTTHTSTFVYIQTVEGVPDDGFDWMPATPDGYELTNVYPIIKAHVTAPSIPILEDTSDWGYSPYPTKYPFLIWRGGTGHYIIIEDFPEGSDPDEPIVCGSPDNLANILAGYGPTTPTNIQVASDPPPSDTSPKIVASYVGWRFLYTRI